MKLFSFLRFSPIFNVLFIFKACQAQSSYKSNSGQLSVQPAGNIPSGYEIISEAAKGATSIFGQTPAQINTDWTMSFRVNISSCTASLVPLFFAFIIRTFFFVNFLLLFLAYFYFFFG